MTFDSQNEYQIQKILDKKVFNGKTLYLVKWKNYPTQQSTWQCNKLLFNYKDKITEFRRSQRYNQNIPQIKIQEDAFERVINNNVQRRRGRPPKVTLKNIGNIVQKPSNNPQDKQNNIKRGRGRPRGSKNKISKRIQPYQQSQQQQESIQLSAQSDEESNTSTVSIKSKKQVKNNKRALKLIKQKQKAEQIFDSQEQFSLQSSNSQEQQVETTSSFHPNREQQIELFDEQKISKEKNIQKRDTDIQLIKLEVQNQEKIQPQNTELQKQVISEKRQLNKKDKTIIFTEIDKQAQQKNKNQQQSKQTQINTKNKNDFKTLSEKITRIKSKKIQSQINQENQQKCQKQMNLVSQFNLSIISQSEKEDKINLTSKKTSLNKQSIREDVQIQQQQKQTKQKLNKPELVVLNQPKSSQIQQKKQLTIIPSSISKPSPKITKIHLIQSNKYIIQKQQAMQLLKGKKQSTKLQQQDSGSIIEQNFKVLLNNANSNDHNQSQQQPNQISQIIQTKSVLQFIIKTINSKSPTCQLNKVYEIIKSKQHIQQIVKEIYNQFALRSQDQSKLFSNNNKIIQSEYYVQLQNGKTIKRMKTSYLELFLLVQAIRSIPSIQILQTSISLIHNYHMGFKFLEQQTHHRSKKTEQNETVKKLQRIQNDSKDKILKVQQQCQQGLLTEKQKKYFQNIIIKTCKDVLNKKKLSKHSNKLKKEIKVKKQNVQTQQLLQSGKKIAQETLQSEMQVLADKLPEYLQQSTINANPY